MRLMAAFHPTPFGKYYLTQRIAEGGMAEVFKAKTMGAAGVEKTIALKRILPSFSQDENFIGMLVDEARLSVQLTHANIVQVFEFGKAKDQYFLAMEYVPGVSLRQLIDRAKQKGETIPLDTVLYIIAEAARGLHYAHTKQDEAGKPLGIVHRDVSPHNILVSYHGEVKVTDFGIAKAASNLQQTQTGLIKGKVAYLAPEYVTKNQLDARGDLFALGLVGYELLTGRRFFEGTSQIELIERIKTTHIDETMLPANCPIPIRQILLKALAFDPDRRDPTLADFERAVRTYLHQQHPDFTAETLAELLKKFFAAELDSAARQLTPILDQKSKQAMEGAQEEALAAAPASVWDQTLTRELAIPHAATTSLTRATTFTTKRIAFPLTIATTLLLLFVDFAKPFLLLAPLLLVGAVGISGYLYFVPLRRYRRQNPWPRLIISPLGSQFVFALWSTLLWGMLTFVSFFTPNRGLLAANSDAIAHWQERIFRLETGLVMIEQELAEIRTTIEALSKQGGLIPNPKTPGEFYHNAKQWETSGKIEEAKVAYATFLKTRPEFMDVQQTYQRLIASTEGTEGLAKRYATMKTEHPDQPMVALMDAKIKEDRKVRLTEYQHLAKEQNFAPAYLLWARELGKDGFGVGQLNLKEASELKEAIETFFALEEQDPLQQYFIDTKALEDERTIANNMRTLVGSLGISQRIAKPIAFNMEQYGGGVSLTFSPMEAGVKKIWYAMDDPNPTMDTGTSPYVTDPMTGAAVPNYSVNGKMSLGKHTVSVKYQRSDDSVSDAYLFEFIVLPFIVRMNPMRETLGSPTALVDLTFIPLDGGSDWIFYYGLDNIAVPTKTDPFTPTSAQIPAVSPGKHTLYAKGVAKDGHATEVLPFVLEVP